MKTDKVVCRTPTPGKKATRLAKEKFDLVRRAILRVTPRQGQGVCFWEIPRLIKQELTPSELRTIGSLMWHVTVVKLEMEVRGELERVPDRQPQHLRRTSARRDPARPRR
jgi:hypothetical protein